MMSSLDAAAVAAFTDEFRLSLPAIQTAIEEAARDPLDRVHAREAYRLIHALKGAASMVGLAAFGYLLNVIEEQLDKAIAAKGPLADDVVAIVREAMPLCQAYMDSALAGQSVEPVALNLLRALRQDDGVAAATALRELIEIESREIDIAPATEEPAGPPPVDESLAMNALADLPLPEAPRPTLALVEREPAPALAPPAPTPAPAYAATPAPAYAAIPAPAHAAAPATPAPALDADFEIVPSTPVPPELAEIFGEEAQEHLETIARVTAALDASKQDLEAIQELRRAVHTLKGAAGVVGYLGAAKLAHRMEDLLDRLYEGAATLTEQSVRTLSTSSDVLHDMIQSSPDVARLTPIVARLFGEYGRLLDSEPVAAAPVEAAPMAALEPAAPAELPALPAVETATNTPEPPAPIAAAAAPVVVERRRRHADRRQGAVLRVPVDRLNELVRVVSELVINRSTFEQHHLALIEQVDELKLSTARLRRVTHKLESDYEVRALGGQMSMIGPGGTNAAGSSGGHGFDDLEFDRYTEFHLLTRELTEITSDIATIGNRVAGTIGDFDSDLTRLSRLTRDVQDKTMEFRMVPLGTLTTQLERAVRSTGEMCGKHVDFSIEGEHVALDKSLLEQMSEPLLHLLRNAVDHGIEKPPQRAASGKPERGRITVRGFHEGTDVLIEVEDDGAGLDLDRIRRTAIARGYVTEAAAAAMAPDALFAFIFEPGFSTAERITEVSGRGVGMDVVKSKVNRLSGRVYVTSRPGAGTTISVRVPMTLAITRILLVRSGGEILGLPLAAVVQIARPHPSSIGVVGSERVFTLDGQTYPLRDLAETLGLPRAADAPAIQPILIANLSRRRIALAVDEIINSRDAVVKTLGTHLRRVAGIWGATLLGDGTVVLILNPVDLAGAAEGSVVVRAPAPRVSSDHEPYQVLVVDDSLSMRHVLSVAVKKAGWTPIPARDGLEALDLIQRASRPPDLVLLDIEMPRMDGFEFLSTIRSQKGRSDLPIVMLTSRSGEKHRDKATALGATDYMVKPFQEDTLIRNIDRLVQASRNAARRAAS
jgi:chemosensory pili system protein ChpA (sensor histidine kinase/response regulator)